MKRVFALRLSFSGEMEMSQRRIGRFSMFSGPQSHMRMLSSTFLAVLTSATLIAALLAAPQTANASDLVIKYDQSQILRLPTPVSEIIIVINDQNLSCRAHASRLRLSPYLG